MITMTAFGREVDARRYMEWFNGQRPLFDDDSAEEVHAYFQAQIGTLLTSEEALRLERRHHTLVAQARGNRPELPPQLVNTLIAMGWTPPGGGA